MTKPALPAPDADQRAVIEATGEGIRVVAPAGSGKTVTLARRVQRRIEAGIDPQRILVLTFDNNARISFETKLAALDLPRGVRVSTLNAWGYGVLRSAFPDERSAMMRGVYFAQTPLLSELGGETGYRIVGEMLSRIKNEIIDPRTVAPRTLASWCAKNRTHLLRDLENEQIVAGVSDTDFGAALAQELRFYEQFLLGQNAIDFDDQKLRPLLRLKQSPTILERIQASVDEVIVDEFQDINRLDSELIDLIAAKSTLVITGDDDQAIYGFRGASATWLITPDRAFDRGFTHIELSTNYRCPPRILNHANALIEHNQQRIPKHPSAAKRVQGTIDVHEEASADAEANWIAARAATIGTTDTGAARSIAVLARRNLQLLPLQEQFILAGTPYVVDARQDIRITWSAAIRLLALAPELHRKTIEDPDARAELVRIFASVRTIPAHVINRLVRIAQDEQRAFPDEVLAAMQDREQEAFLAGITAMRYRRTMREYLGELTTFLNAEVSTATDNGRNAPRLSKIAQLQRIAGDYGTRRKAFITHVEKLLDAQRAIFRDPSLPRVELSTCHGAKGREWQVVFLPQCSQGLFPDERSMEGIYLEAERKLFYVSMTRAAEHFIATWSTEFGRNGRPGEPSQFLVEAGLITPPPPPPARRFGNTRRDEPRRTTLDVRAREIDLQVAHRKRTRAAAAPRKAAEPVPPATVRLLTPRGRAVATGTDVDAVRGLVDRIAREEEHDGIATSRMTIAYADASPDSTLALQLDLALRGIPFAIEDAHRFSESALFQRMCQGWESDTVAYRRDDQRDTVDAMQRMLEIATSSTDRLRWRRKIEQILDEEAGRDPSGVQFNTDSS